MNSLRVLKNFRSVSRSIRIPASNGCINLGRNAYRVQLAKAPFSFSSIRRSSHTAGNPRSKLINALSSEIDYEKNQVLSEISLPPVNYDIEDVQGSAVVVLKAKHGDENIRITMNVSQDVTDAVPEEQDFTEFEDEQELQNQGESAEDEFPNEDLGRFQPCTIEISKPGNGALVFEATALDDGFDIENIYFSKDIDMLTSDSLEAEWKRRKQYLGPSFKELDPELQDLFHSYLEERKIDESLSSFIVSFGLTKELKEYINWLESVRQFLK
ncbi:Mitochondrial acidic protein mam33 [Schizosaccharomyces pombe]